LSNNLLAAKMEKRNGPAEQKKNARIGKRAMSLYGLGKVKLRTTTAIPPF